MAWDAVVVLGVFASLIVLGTLTESIPRSGRVLLAAIVSLVLFYEPLMVARYGATVGHRKMNLRVVRDATGGNPGFLRATLRFLIKGVLGLASFAAISLTERHQAIHDRLTGTTVRIRDLAAASPDEMLFERELPTTATLPSRRRRVVVILAYLVLLFVGMSIGSVLMLSRSCVAATRCSDREAVVQQLIGLAWLCSSIWCVFAGWRGKLAGARARA